MEPSEEPAPRKKRVLDDQQRAKNRLIVKKCYYKKLNTLNELRSEVEKLEAQYDQLLFSHHREHAQPSSPSDEVKAEDEELSKMHSAYVQLTQLRSALVKENAELKRLGTLYNTMEKQVEHLSISQTKALVAAQATQEQKLANPTLVINPLTMEQCNAIARAAYGEIVAFRSSKTRFSTGSNIFGWRDRHKIYPDKLVFSLEKVYHGLTVDRMTEGTWRIISQADSAAKLYTSNMKTRFHLTQQLGDNMVIYHHTLEREDSDVRVRTFFIAMRVDLGVGRFLVFYRSIDPKAYLRQEGEAMARDPRGRKKVEPQNEDVWMNMFIWGVFEPEGDHNESCRAEFGGVIEGTTIATSGWWCLEMLQICMKIETQVVGSQFLLH